MRIVSFATDQPFYRDAAEALRRDCDGLGVAHDIRVLQRWGGSKRERVIYKPTFIRELLEEHNQPLLWVDVDSRLSAGPATPDTRMDVGVAANPYGTCRGLILTAGAIFVRPNSRTEAFLQDWENRCKESPRSGFGDHYYLVKTACNHIIQESTVVGLLMNELSGVTLCTSAQKVEKGVPRA